MRNLQGSADTELDQSMGRKAARLAAKPHVVGSIALDERLRANSGGGNPVFAEPTVIIAGIDTAVVTITFTLPPGTVCHDGSVNLVRLSIAGANRDLDNRSEPLVDPSHWVGWFGNGQDGEATVEGLTADEMAALWHSGGTFPHTGSGTEMRSTASGNVVTLTEVGNGIISAAQVNWQKA